MLTMLLILLAGAEVPATMDPAAIPNYQVLRPGLAVAGKPSPEALAKLKDHGFKTVIDLRSEAEGLAEEKAIVESQGLRYVSVPITATTFSLEDARAGFAALRFVESRGRRARGAGGEGRPSRGRGDRDGEEGGLEGRSDGRGGQACDRRARHPATSALTRRAHPRGATR
jgi:hypothetical protein